MVVDVSIMAIGPEKWPPDSLLKQLERFPLNVCEPLSLESIEGLLAEIENIDLWAPVGIKTRAEKIASKARKYFQQAFDCGISK